MVTNTHKPIYLLPVGLLAVLAMLLAWAVPAQSQNGEVLDNDPPTVTIAKTADELREGSSALVYRLMVDPALLRT